VTSLCAIEALYAKSPDSVKNCIAAAGFSVGEITALIFSGAISFEDGVKLVKGHFERE
jgi:[acyl-carrier-protein] S-malonyltransferase